MLFPKKKKFQKEFKGKIRGQTIKGSKIVFGTFALKTIEEARITSEQIEACRRIITKKMKRLGFLWIRIFPDIPVTNKPTEVRMGKGKGSFDRWVSKIKKGQILFEISGLSKELAIKALQSGSNKLPIQTKIIF